MGIVPGMSDHNFKNRFDDLELFSLGIRLRGRLIEIFKIVWSLNQVDIEWQLTFS